MTRRRDDEAGSAVVETLLVIGFVSIFVVAVADLSMQTFQKGAVHSAVDQAARIGATQPGDGAPACETRIRQALANMLRGPAGAGATIGCSDDGDVVAATVRIHLRAWVPGWPDADLNAVGTYRKERLPSG